MNSVLLEPETEPANKSHAGIGLKSNSRAVRRPPN